MDNDSPFANTNSLIVLYLEPYLNTFYKSYQNIITLNAMPTGPLALLVSSISSPRLSPFYDTSPFTSYPQCTFALLRYPNNSSTPHSPKNPDFFMRTGRRGARRFCAQCFEVRVPIRFR